MIRKKGEPTYYLRDRGGFLQIGFSYYFNLNNFKKTSGYFY